ncbi:MAG: C40 family peptidase [Bacteroidota bacterium]
MKSLKLTFIILFATFQFGFGQQLTLDKYGDAVKCYKNGYYSQVFGFQLPDKFNTLLYDTLEIWLGTPYRSAGNSKLGVDCSGFVTCMYNRVYGLKLNGRRCSEIYNEVDKVSKDDLQEGDIVFFKIRHSQVSHVGLYLGNDKFIHSSTSNGVIISDLKEDYYQRYFWGGGRLKQSSLFTQNQE